MTLIERLRLWSRDDTQGDGMLLREAADTLEAWEKVIQKAMYGGDVKAQTCRFCGGSTTKHHKILVIKSGEQGGKRIDCPVPAALERLDAGD